MPKLSWNEIRQRAIHFSRDWCGVGDERSEAQSFWNEFFVVFGKQRRLLASFEEKVKSLKGTYHRIDLFWPGRLLAEHKSAGQSLAKAESQAFQYIAELASSNREDEIPQFVVVSDFARIVLYDLEPEEGDGVFEFPLEDFHKHIKHFAFFIGQKTHRFGEEDPANLKAAGIMADLHDAIEQENYTGAELERLLVRLLFCLFAEDTGIFETSQFELFIENHTKEDGTDLGAQLNHLFEVLDTPQDQRVSNLDEDIADFPYINGELFEQRLRTAGFNPKMRDCLVEACRFDWSRISPAIFGSLFQGIMDDKERRQIGAHYTSERDILKLIRPLFLDELKAEFEQIRQDSRKGHRDKRLIAFQEKLRKLKFLDPACGCGNFLVIAYRELRRLELKVLKLRHDFDRWHEELPVGEALKLSNVDVDQFYGIEIGEWPVRIAETALWLTDHQMNTELSLSTGNIFQRIPLKAAPHIRCANALRMDWNDLLAAKDCSYVLGNPPFIGAKEKTAEQREDLDRVWIDVKSHRILDYVTCWYRRATDYMSMHDVKAAFVSTNSITQGEQVGILWNKLTEEGVKINFAHRTFSWQSEAKGKAHVHCVIIGFAKHDSPEKRLFEYEDVNGEPIGHVVSNINAYLVEGPNVSAVTRNKPICESAPMMTKGSEATDKGHLLMNDAEKSEILRANPQLSRFIREYAGGNEFIKGVKRWCFWLADASPQEFRQIPEIKERLIKVKSFRASSPKKRTVDLSRTPYLFGEIRQPQNSYLMIPKVSSERRTYIPIGFLPKEVIANGSSLVLPDANLFHFGLISSAMHMGWMRQVCGRMKSDYQYSVSIVYNNYPWPVDASESQKVKVEECAGKVLDVRQGFLDDGSTLADLYDPLYMPAPLLKAHQELDRVVDRCYRGPKFSSERERVEFLFELYETLTAPLAASAPAKKKRRTRKKKEDAS